MKHPALRLTALFLLGLILGGAVTGAALTRSCQERVEEAIPHELREEERMRDVYRDLELLCQDIELSMDLDGHFDIMFLEDLTSLGIHCGLLSSYEGYDNLSVLVSQLRALRYENVFAAIPREDRAALVELLRSLQARGGKDPMPDRYVRTPTQEEVEEVHRILAAAQAAVGREANALPWEAEEAA